MTFTLSQKYQQVATQIFKENAISEIPIYVFEFLDSTNTKLWELIDNNLEIPAATVALQQTSGKGQWGKNWQSGLGGLYLSVAIECDLALNNNFHLIMATAAGITNSLRNYQLPVTIKWSNDLILDRHKLGGIKIETRAKNNSIKYAVIGVGINWQNQFPSLGISLNSFYKKCQINRQLPYINSLEKLTAIAIIGILKGIQDYREFGANYTHQKYQKLLNSIGRKVIINSQSGTVVAVTSEGKLQVRFQSPGATTNIYFKPGEISLGYDELG